MTRDRISDEGAGVAQYPVLTDKPIEIHNPQRKMRLLALVYALALIVTAVVGAYIAATVAIARNDDSKRQLLREIDERSQQRTAEADRFERALDQYRRDQCEITGRLEQSPEIAAIRVRYRCTNPVTPPGAAPVPSPPVVGTPTVPTVPQARTGASGPGPAPARPQVRPAPAPQAPRPVAPPSLPDPRPGTPPAPPPDPLPPALCLPLLGVCLF